MQNRSKASRSCQFFQPLPTQSKPTISIGQALLILIDHYKKRNKPVTCGKVKELYMRGATSQDIEEGLKKLRRHPVLKNYRTTSNAYITDADPTRRYFETHLAYHTLKQQLKKIDMGDLLRHFDSAFEMLPILDRENATSIFNKPFSQISNAYEDLIKKEYNDAIRKLSSSDHYKQFLPDEKEKLCLLMKISYISIYLATINNKTLPINIYGTGLFADSARGRIAKDIIAQSGVKSPHLGLMKSYMPVPADDLATSNELAPYLRPADEYTFDPKSKWAKINFRTQVHPFSCSISGTLLGQLRVMKCLHEKQRFEFGEDEKFKDYLRCYIAFLLYNSGGHSLHEFTYLFQSPEVKKAFEFIPEFTNFNEDTLFRVGNEAAFDQALQETTAYHKVLLAKKNMHWLLQQQKPPIEPIEYNEKTKEKVKKKPTPLGVNRYKRNK